MSCRIIVIPNEKVAGDIVKAIVKNFVGVREFTDKTPLTNNLVYTAPEGTGLFHVQVTNASTPLLGNLRFFAQGFASAKGVTWV